MKTISVILTLWKRNHISEQLEALSKQSITPTEILIYHCGDAIRLKDRFFQVCPNIKYQHNTHDLGYFGRFSLGLLVLNPYLYILDDDVIPSPYWLETCIDLCEKYNSIISSSGRLIPKGDYSPELLNYAGKVKECFIGDSYDTSYNYCAEDTYVDFGCNSWFLKTEWLRYFWALKPYTMETGEDIHLSASCSIGGNIKTLCPKQNDDSVCGNIKKYYGYDDLASWKKDDFVSKRAKILRFLIDDCGWVPQKW